MTQRDIAKDKELLESVVTNAKLNEAKVALPYWIARYEAAQSKLDELGSGKYIVMLADTYNKDVDDFKALQARISELESLLHPNNRPDVVTRPEHDRALGTIFGKWDWLR